MPDPDQDAGPGDRARWIPRWELQQQGSLPDREDRFTALIDAVEEAAGRPDPLVLDLGCGPGSLSVRLLDRIPAAPVVAVDADPVLLALARAAYGQRDGLRFADVDLRSNGWSAALGLDRPADAAVSTTALHWLRPDALHLMYARLATVLRPGGLLLDGDHLKDDAAAVPTLARLGRVLIEREEQRRFPDGLPETWSGWWEAIKEDPALAAPLAEREQRRLTEDHHGRSPSSWPPTWRGCAPRASPRSAPSGSAARTASWSAFSPPDPSPPPEHDRGALCASCAHNDRADGEGLPGSRGGRGSAGPVLVETSSPANVPVDAARAADPLHCGGAPWKRRSPRSSSPAAPAGSRSPGRRRGRGSAADLRAVLRSM